MSEMITIDEALAAIRKQTKDRKEVMDTLPKREWVGLTQDEVCDLMGIPNGSANSDINIVKLMYDYYRIEAKLKEKNT